MNEYSPIETRRKSRSKTPFLRSSCDNEACAHAGDEGHTHERRKSPYVKKHPKVTAIIEESNEIQNKHQHIVENTRQKTSAITTSDYSSNSSEDLSTEQQAVPTISGISTNTDGHNKIITTTTVTKKTQNIWNENDEKISFASTSNKQSNQFLSPTVGKQISKEISQNSINSEFEKSKIKTSTPICHTQQITKTTRNSLDSSSPAYKEYKEAGEYWAKYPKTDYTYSKLSPHRREVVPGIVGMPNMSRNSLEKHHERINYMIERSPEQETYIRTRYEPKYQRTRTSREQINAVNNLLYDSQDEVDISVFNHNQSKTSSLQTGLGSNKSESNWIIKMMSFFVTIFDRFCNIFSKNNIVSYVHTTLQGRDTFGNIKSALIIIILSISSYFYLLISSVLYLDTLLLRSSTPDNLSKKRFLLFLLILLPLLLLAGSYYHIHPNEPFPPVNFSQLTEKMPTINLTEITQFVDYENIDQIKANTFEKINNLRAWSEDYFEYVKTVSYNVATETQKIFMENFSN